ncbi:MAG: aminodeoxychorismate synthase component I [Deltaproteobacteria bacterium]
MKIKEFKTSISSADLFQVLEKEPYSFFLDSADECGFSFLGAYPYKIIHSLEALEKELITLSAAQRAVPASLEQFPFLGGAVGYLGYDLARRWEKHLRTQHKQEPFSLPDLWFGLYDTWIAIDHTHEKTFLFSLDESLEGQEKWRWFEEVIQRCFEASSLSMTSATVHPPHSMIESNLSFEAYKAMIEKAKFYIEEGEIYQVNLSQCLMANVSCSPFEIYKKLRKIHPSPFSAYLNLGDFQILSSSPERFIQITKDQLIQTEPIKGTIRRGKNEEEDTLLKTELLQSEKNRAELMMIVDLERNDLGKICHYGSVKVPTLIELRSFATVHHLVSVIEGELKTIHFPDIIKAIFPGGSITGAPKLRAMQIIDELEPHNRGIYPGSIGYVDYRRQADLNIAIRTIVHQKGVVYFPLGGGIVSDSTAESEFAETLQKGKALISAVS